MGKNGRYSSDVTRSAVNDFITRPRPISLSAQELGDDEVHELVDDENVVAWVRYPEQPVEVEGRVIAYTERAAQIEFQHRDGSTQRAWVWHGAVRRPAPGERTR
jgi:hypothetical protein